ncbi:MAG: hypothetical protein KDD97_00635, partial [Rhodobacteraceae bacterium]|nr:hypothetical protein [Paracoccaceae bacterium]
SVVGIEVLMAAQALELRLKERGFGAEALAPASRAVLAMLRATPATDGRPIGHLERDLVLYPRIHKAAELVNSGAVLDAARAALV